jgi:hypothetical protein
LLRFVPPILVPLRIAWLVAVVALGFVAYRQARAEPDDDLALDYLVQKVCRDPSGRVLSVDPYNCPGSSTLRSLEPGEALPYHRYDQSLPGFPESRQRRDSYPVRSADAQKIVINTFDYAPFGQFEPERDGYDITMVRDGWASIGGTRTGREGATTFFSAGCKPYNGWVLFPVSALAGRLIEPGEARMPIRGVHWEQSAQPWPGLCPSVYQTRVLTSWEPLSGFAFGGVADTPTKTIDSIRSIHGFTDSRRFLEIGHLEIFYFTRLYGFTRWETWVAPQRYEADPSLRRRAGIASERCAGPARNFYRGISFTRIACRDWTSVVVPSKPEAAPFWPVPYINR